MSLLTGILVLVLVSAASVALAAVTGRMQQCSAACLFRGSLPDSGGRLPGGHAGGTVAGVPGVAGRVGPAAAQGQRPAYRDALNSPGLRFFVLASLVIWFLFAVFAADVCGMGRVHLLGYGCQAAQGEKRPLSCRSGQPQGIQRPARAGLVSYFVQGFSFEFGEWQCLAGYDMLLMSCLSAAAALPRRRWPHSIAVLAGGVLLPLFLQVWSRREPPAPSTPTPWRMCRWRCFSAGVLCLWFAVGPGWQGVLLTALPLALLTLAKDMGFAYALIAVFVIFLDLVFAEPGNSRAGAAFSAVLWDVPRCWRCRCWAAFLSWNRYTAAHLTTTGASVGSSGLSYGQVVFGGTGTAVGVGRTQKFSDLMGLMADAFFTRDVCLLGAPVLAVAASTLIGAAAFLFAGKGAPRRRVVATWAGLAFCFAAFYLFP